MLNTEISTMIRTNDVHSTKLFFEREDAIKYGVEEAIMLSNTRFWILKNKENKKNYQSVQLNVFALMLYIASGQ